MSQSHDQLKQLAKEYLLHQGFLPDQIFEEYFVNVGSVQFRIDVVGISDKDSIAIECGTTQPERLSTLKYFFNKVIHVPYGTCILTEERMIDEIKNNVISVASASTTSISAPMEIKEQKLSPKNVIRNVYYMSVADGLETVLKGLRDSGRTWVLAKEICEKMNNVMKIDVSIQSLGMMLSVMHYDRRKSVSGMEYRIQRFNMVDNHNNICRVIMEHNHKRGGQRKYNFPIPTISWKTNPAEYQYQYHLKLRQALKTEEK